MPGRKATSILAAAMLAAYAMSANGGVVAELDKVKDAPAFEAKALSEGVDEGALKRIFNAESGEKSPLSSKLDGAEFLIEFKEPQELQWLGVCRYAWQDWSVPLELGVRVNGGKERVYKIESPKVNPQERRHAGLPAELLPLKAESVKNLEIRVAAAEALANKHGGFKLLLPKSATSSLPIQEEVPRDAIGLTANVEAGEDDPCAELQLSAYRFRGEIAWSAPIPLKKGVSSIDLRWNEFISAKSPSDLIEPLTLIKASVRSAKPWAAPKLKEIKFVRSPGGKLTAAWEGLEELDMKADAEGWRQGIPCDGFGRFGFTFNKSLLACKVELGSGMGLFTDAPKDKLDLAVSCGGSDTLSWRRVKADWTGVEALQLTRASKAKGDEPLSKAFGVYDKSRLPETWVCGILTPGFLLKSSDKLLNLKAEAGAGAPWALLPEKSGPRWAKIGDGVELDGLSEGWLLLAWEDRKRTPVLLALSRKPERIASAGELLALAFREEMDFIGFGAPAGYRGWNGAPGAKGAETEALARKARLLASLLRAYPRNCSMRFVCEGSSVRFKESFSYVCWENDWNEPWLKARPAPPLLCFASDSGYPVKWPSGKPEDTGIDTQYGPYRIWKDAEGRQGSYELPVPDFDTRLYLRPEGDPLAAKAADAICKHLDLDSEARPNPKNDSLGAWWMYSPASLALPLLDESQKAALTRSWRFRVADSFSPRAWHLRTEPFSGARYPMSFAWTDKSAEVLGDPNSGIGAELYGAWAYARSGGDWELLEKNWAVLSGALRFFLYCHDWNNMQTGCREHTAASCIDMDGIAYEGAAAFLQMAETLGKADEAALGRMLLSRLALSTAVRWQGMAWKSPALKREQWDGIGVGLNPDGFNIQNCRAGGPNFVNSELALSLSWVGQYPELYNLHIWGGGVDFWRFVEYSYLENKIEDWRKPHKGGRNWHDANVTAHLYMRALLGAKQEELLSEMNGQRSAKGEKWYFEPDPRLACENAAYYALFLGRDIPVSIRGWGMAKLKSATYSKESKTARIELESAAEGKLKLELLAPCVKFKAGGSDSGKLPKGAVELPIKTGATKFELTF